VYCVGKAGVGILFKRKKNMKQSQVNSYKLYYNN